MIELLVVIAVIGILMAMLMPAVQQVREASRRTDCLNRIRQLGIALHGFEGAHKRFPASRTQHPGPPPVNTIAPPSTRTNAPPSQRSAYQSWSTLILPYIEQDNVKRIFNYQQPWFSFANEAAVSVQQPLFLCPSAPGENRTDPYWIIGAAAGDYGSLNEVRANVFLDAGVNPAPPTRAQQGALERYRRTSVRDITDGLSNTIMLAEAAGHPEVWTSQGLMTNAMWAIYQVSGGGKVALHNGQFVVSDGCGWADPDCGFSVDGASFDGLTHQGPRLINAINASEIFAFHQGGASFLYCDGATRFINENVDNRSFIFQITKAGGEIVTVEF